MAERLGLAGEAPQLLVRRVAGVAAVDDERDPGLVEARPERVVLWVAGRATTLGAVKTRIDIQKNFADAMKSAIDKGVGQLVDADMNEESTRLQALQVRQQLGIQALSIANQQAQGILSLFR